MWVFNEDGFFSVVQHLDDPSLVLVRTRARAPLEKFVSRVAVLQDEYRDLHGTEVEWYAEVHATPDADYPFRVTVPRAAWAAYMQSMVEGMEYTNYKDRMHEHDDLLLDRSLMQVWAVMQRYGRSASRGKTETSSMFGDIA